MKKHLTLIIGIALPVIIIAIVAVSVYLPSKFLKTDYNFVYATCGDGSSTYYYSDYRYYCDRGYLDVRYSVEDGKLVYNAPKAGADLNKNGVEDKDEKVTVRFFLHDTLKDESKEITFEDAQKFDYSGLLTSPDGVAVTSGYESNPDVFPFFYSGGSQYKYYLTKGSKKKEVNMVLGTEGYYSGGFKFVGWVLPGRDTE